MTRDVELVVVGDAESAARRTAELLAAAARAGGHVALTGQALIHIRSSRRRRRW
jgi:16S rRNA G1207 methylase RsmC